jgi:hypothetical protein
VIAYVSQAGQLPYGTMKGYLRIISDGDDGDVCFRGTKAEILSEIDNLRFSLDDVEEEVSKW